MRNGQNEKTRNPKSIPTAPVVTVRRRQINLAEFNPRKIEPENRARLGEGLREFGLVEHPVWNKRTGRLVGGHQRLSLLDEQHAGADYALAVAQVDLAPRAEKKLNLLLNNPKAQGAWDAEKLGAILAELEGDLAATGFAEADLRELEQMLGAAREDTPPDTSAQNLARLQKKWQSAPGQLWALGAHRLLCGDSTAPESFEKLLGNEKPALLVTSPPYAQQREYDKKNSGKSKSWDELIEGVFGAAKLSEDAQVLVNLGLVHSDGEWIPYWEKWIEWMRSKGWKRFGLYVWDQGWGLPGDWNGRFAPSFEFVFHFNKTATKLSQWVAKQEDSIGPRSGNNTILRSKDGKTKAPSSLQSCHNTHKIPDSVIRVNRAVTAGKIESAHPAVYSVGLADYLIKSFTSQIVLDPFLGSGTTLIACEQLGRRCRAIEISPAYVAVALQRWADLTKQTPKLVK